MLYKVAITETKRRIVTINANTPTEAHSRVTDAWRNGEIYLDDEYFDGVEVYVVGEATGDENLYNIERKE